MTMLDYYCYVYYDTDWVAYYVGKGSNRRADYRNDSILVPPAERIQRFYFQSEFEAYECEVELISFWKRMLDGGSLVNQTLGGAGALGFRASPQDRANRSRIRKELASLPDIIEKCNQATRTPITLVHLETNTERSFVSVQEASRQLELNASHISAVRHRKRKSHKGWIVK